MVQQFFGLANDFNTAHWGYLECGGAFKFKVMLSKIFKCITNIEIVDCGI